jgi:pimeloyl-ACP methyl ester carboxylesterase
MIRDLGHIRSPLSSTTLVHRAFFSPSCPASDVEEFEKLLSERDSLLWPLSMLLPFVNTKRVIQGVLGWGGGVPQQRVMIVAGGRDVLMGTWQMERMAKDYVRAYRASFNQAALRAELAGRENNGESVLMTGDGVRFVVVNGAGHHVQNDIQWEEGARQILAFLEQL